MSKTTAPLLSFGASGQIAKTMVAATWKGIPYMRKYSKPANPNTAAQQAQRNLMTSVVAAWRSYITDATARDAWKLAAQSAASPMSGFNLFTSNAVKVAASDPDASFCDEASEAANVVTIATKNLDDGATGDETGNFEVWVGSTATNLQLLETASITAGDIVTSALTGAAGIIKYVQIRKDSYLRSGTYKIVLSGV